MMLKIDSFQADRNLMFLIQQVTKESTGDILSYFQHMILSIAEDYVSRHPKKRINKTLQWHYKNTAIPYKLEVYTGYREDFSGPTVNLISSLRFPRKNETLDLSKMMDQLVESSFGLEGSEPLPNFSAPLTRVPAGFKKLLHE